MKKYPLIHKPSKPLLTLPQVQNPVRGEGKFLRQSSCPSRYGHVILLLEPNPDMDGCFMLWSVTENQIPKAYLEEIYQGLCALMTEETQDSSHYTKYIPFPYQNTNIRIVGGTHHEADSTGICYRIAASFALEKAVSQCQEATS